LAAGSSIIFVPTDGKAATAGATTEAGKYTAKVPVRTAKVEIRVSRHVSASSRGPDHDSAPQLQEPGDPA
jgi:hypothetical protein